MSQTVRPQKAAPPTRTGGKRRPTADLQAMTEALRTFNTARKWEQFHSPRNLAMALSVEAAELLELFLWSEDGGPQPALPERAARVPEEAADVLMCLLNLCDRTGVDLEAAFWRKLALNRRHYPVRRARGSMRKYNETSVAAVAETSGRGARPSRGTPHKTEPPRSQIR